MAEDLQDVVIDAGVHSSAIGVGLHPGRTGDIENKHLAVVTTCNA